MLNNHGDRFRPLNGVMGPLINGRFMAYKWRLLTSQLLTNWDDPPSRGPPCSSPPCQKLQQTLLLHLIRVRLRSMVVSGSRKRWYRSNMDHLKMYFLLKLGTFHCNVSLLEGKLKS